MLANSLKRNLLMMLTAAAAVSMSVAPAKACFMHSTTPVQVWLHNIQIDINDQVAVRTYDCTFKNANSRAVVGGVCYLELEPGAQVDNMTVLVDGKEMKAEVLDVAKAKKVFNEIVKNGGSPALLEYYGNQLIQTKIPRIAPGSTVKVKLSYTTVLKKRGGVVRLQCLKTNAKSLNTPVKSASVTVNINSKQPIKNVYSPTHNINIEEKEGWDVSVSWNKDNYLPKHPFVLYYQTDENAIAASVVAHRELDEEGHFMMMLSPTVGKGAGQVTAKQILPKDVVFCVDTSGSMHAGGKMDQARKALEYCISTLRPGDRFNIVDFSTSARSFHKDGLVAFNAESKADALKYAGKLKARGGTAINDALELSLKHLGKKDAGNGRLKMMVFATDGLPTLGERDPQAILRNMAKQNTEDVRIFVFGEGFDVNTKLLDFLAINHRGESDYILPNENITEKIGRFFDRVGSPVMTNLEISFEGLETKDVYPKKISDVFKGEQVMVYGRFTGHGPKTIKLTGYVKGEKKSFTYKLDFPEYSQDDSSSFVPRLWAGRKVESLLNEIRKSQDGKTKPSKELVDEVTYLAKRYGIVTPYTSFLVTDDVAGKPTATGPGGIGGGPMPVPLLRRELAKRLQGQAAAPASADQKRDQIRNAGGFARFRAGAAKGKLAELDAAADNAYAEGGRKKGSSLAAIRTIGSQTFYKSGNTWYDSRYDAKVKNLTKITVGSDDYFALLASDARIAKLLALTDVVITVKGKWYHIVPAKK